MSFTQPRSQTATRLYFRRWTRSAAVFHSLGHCVTIGHLTASVLERLSAKTMTLATTSAVCGLLTPSAGENEEEQEAHEETLLCGLFGELISTLIPATSAQPSSSYLLVAPSS
mgnify:CR=1 FL=1